MTASANGQNEMIEGHEKTVLSVMLNDRRSFDVELDDFSSPTNRTIFEAISAVNVPGLLPVQDELRRRRKLAAVGGAAELTALYNMSESLGDPSIDYALSEVLDAARGRRTKETGAALAKGDITGEEAIERLAKSGRAKGSRGPLIEFRSPLQLKSYLPPPGIVLVGDNHIVRGSVFVIGGAPGVGKSRATSALAEAGATGKDWFGLEVHRQFKTMIVQSENGEFRLSREFQELDCDTLEDYVRICPPPPFGLCFQREDFRAQLAAAIADFSPDVLVFDPWNAASRDEKAREYLETFDAIRSVLPAGDAAPALGIVAHTRKPKADERASGRGLLNLLAGSYVLGSVPRSAFIMQAGSDETTDSRVVWTCAKNNDGELGPRTAWERRNGLFASVTEFDFETFDAPEKDRREAITEADVAAIFEAGALTKNAATKQLESNTGASRASCYRALNSETGRFAKHLRFKNGKLDWQ